MECVILFRNPSNGEVGVFMRGDDLADVHTFKNMDEAVDFQHPIIDAGWPYQIVELDEL